MAQFGKAISPNKLSSQLVSRPGHQYWNDSKLTANRAIWSWKNKQHPTVYGGNSSGLAAGALAIPLANIYNSSNADNAAYHQNIGQTPAGDIEVDMPTFAASDFGLLANDYIEFSYSNLSTGNTITIDAANNGYTAVGSLLITGPSTALYRIYCLTATTAELIRLN